MISATINNRLMINTIIIFPFLNKLFIQFYSLINLTSDDLTSSDDWKSFKLLMADK